MVSLQFITHQTERYSYLESARMALEGGCKWIQLRMKDAPLEEVETVALQLKPLCKEYEAILILDDHVELAKKLEVDGVHLGKKDMPIDQARQILGEAFIIGGTPESFGWAEFLWNEDGIPEGGSANNYLRPGSDTEWADWYSSGMEQLDLPWASLAPQN